MPKRILIATTAVALLALLPPQPVQAQGSKGQPVTPAKITFADDPSHEIQSDGGPYASATGLDVFIGSQANDGNIWLRTKDLNGDGIFNDSGRKISLTLPSLLPPNACSGLPSGKNNFDFATLISDVNSTVSGGVFGIAPGDSVMTPMRIRFFSGGDAFFVNFKPGTPGACKNKSGLVRVQRALDGASWTVSDDGSACVEKFNPKGQGDFCFSGAMDFSFSLVQLP